MNRSLLLAAALGGALAIGSACKSAPPAPSVAADQPATSASASSSGSAAAPSPSASVTIVTVDQLCTRFIDLEADVRSLSPEGRKAKAEKCRAAAEGLQKRRPRAFECLTTCTAEASTYALAKQCRRSCLRRNDDIVIPPGGPHGAPGSAKGPAESASAPTGAKKETAGEADLF